MEALSQKLLQNLLQVVEWSHSPDQHGVSVKVGNSLPEAVLTLRQI